MVILENFNLLFEKTSSCKILIIYTPHLDYGGAVFDQASNESFHQSLESLQYSAAIAITRAIKRTSSEKLFQELGLETLKSRRCLRKLCLFYKVIIEKSPANPFELIPDNNTICIIRSVQKSQIPFLKIKTNFSKVVSFLQ